MKKVFLGSLVLLVTSSAFTQGTVVFNNRNGTTAHVWSPGTNNASLRLSGAGPNDNPSGSVNFAAAGMTIIGTGGTSGQWGAATTLAQLLGAPGVDAPESSLQAAISPPVSFRTGQAAGNVAPVVATFSNIADSAHEGTFEMVAWDNSSGLYPTWDLALAAWQQGLIVGGRSELFNLYYIGGHLNPPPLLTPLRSFNLYALPTSAASPSALTLHRNSDGTMALAFSGTPGAAYLIQAAADAGSSGWTTISTNNADANGSIAFTDVEASGHASRLYRAVAR